MENLVYIIYIIPFAFLWVAYKYRVKFYRLQGSGKIPDIVNSQQKQTLFFMLALLSTVIILITSY